jgi:type I restriction enzyme S subunit
MKVEEVRLGDIAHIKNGAAFKSKDYINSGIRIIRITNVQKGKIVDDNPQFISLDRQKEFEDYKLVAGDILISLTGNVGRVGILQKEHEPAALNQRVAKIQIFRKDVHAPYVYSLLNSDKFETEAIKNSRGIAQLNLSSKWIEDYRLPLPPIEEQIRIADVLSRAESLIAKRKETIRMLDEYLKSTFIEMFGDPVRNEKGWKVTSLNDVIKDINSGTSYGGVENKDLDENELGVLKISAVTQGVFNPKEYKAVSKSKITKKLLFVKKGMLLFSRANTKELTGACCIVDKDYPRLFLPDKLWSIVVDTNSMHPIFLNNLLKQKSFRNLIRGMASGGHQSMLNISMQKFNNLKIPKPGLEIQKEFVNIAEKIEIVKKIYMDDFVCLESIYLSLNKKYL